MKQLIPHLTMKNCEQTINYYQEVFGGEIKNVQLADGNEMFKGHEGKYIHSELHINENCVMYMNDTFHGDVQHGNAIQLSLDLESEEEIDRIYHVLSASGTVKMELQDTFWNARYAVVTDKHGITWELNVSK
ncbi:VOC family protein [Virgibacillus halophilus]|uniref:VOC family protein n=2 Tax=Tigheibacillus halophilus TaxID=361280 RepID=A0ABU5C6Y6_9BACI|nr:VOC family protein [Virgibacillus halophilus]